MRDPGYVREGRHCLAGVPRGDRRGSENLTERRPKIVLHQNCDRQSEEGERVLFPNPEYHNWDDSELERQRCVLRPVQGCSEWSVPSGAVLHSWSQRVLARYQASRLLGWNQEDQRTAEHLRAAQHQTQRRRRLPMSCLTEGMIEPECVLRYEVLIQIISIFNYPWTI